MLRVGITCPVFLTTIALVGRFPHCPITSLAGIQFLDKKTIAKTIDYLWDFGLLLEYHGSHGNFLLYLQMSILTSNTAEVIQFDQTSVRWVNYIATVRNLLRPLARSVRALLYSLVTKIAGSLFLLDSSQITRRMEREGQS